MYDLLDHPAKWNVGESMMIFVLRITSADICVPSTYYAREPERSKTYRHDLQQTTPLRHLLYLSLFFFRVESSFGLYHAMARVARLASASEFQRDQQLHGDTS
jgi:hypothetical protein